MPLTRWELLCHIKRERQNPENHATLLPQVAYESLAESKRNVKTKEER